MLIKIIDYRGKCHFVSPDEIVRISDAATSSKWHGINSIVKLRDGTFIEAANSCESIAASLVSC